MKESFALLPRPKVIFLCTVFVIGVLCPFVLGCSSGLEGPGADGSSGEANPRYTKENNASRDATYPEEERPEFQRKPPETLVEEGDRTVQEKAFYPDSRTIDRQTIEEKSPEIFRCYSLGQRYKPGGTLACCRGLKAGSLGTFPRCESPLNICVQCGDRQCDSANGESPCNCPEDCKKPACLKDVDCGRKSCRQLGKDCEETIPTCSKGLCSPSTKRLSGHTCENSGECHPTPQCIVDGDCGSRRCLGQNPCTLFTPRCINNKCRTIKNQYANVSCDGVNGICRALPPECRSPCDCKQGQTCDKGKCVTGSSPVYCCEKTGCLSGNTCVDKKGNKGNCPCTKHSDCGKQSCRNSGSSCVRLTPTCNTGICSSASQTVANASCDVTTNNCKSKGKPCKSDSDCPSACKHDTRLCTLTPGLCKNGICAKGSPKSHLAHSCNAAQNACEKRKCTTSTQCGKAYCENQGANCKLYSLLCRSGACLVQSTVSQNAFCDKYNRCIKRCNRDYDCGRRTCRQVGSSCSQKSHYCEKNICKTSSISFGKKVCIPSTGKCIECRNARDCPRAKCSVRSRTCYQSTYSCVNQKCQLRSASYFGGRCSALSGRCS